MENRVGTADRPDITAVKKEAILESLSKFSNVSKSCKAAHICRDTFYEWCKKDKEFANRVKQVEEALIDTVEGALYRRAFGYEYVETTREPTLVKSQKDGQDQTACFNTELIVTKEVTKKIAPDTTALIYVTSNRRSRRWKARQTPGAEGGDIKNINISVRVSGNGQGGNGGNPQVEGKSIERILNGL